MIKHIVIWQLKEENKQANALQMKKNLESLLGIIPEILKIKVWLNIDDSPYTNADILLECEFNSMEDLEIYQNHEKHKAVAEFTRGVVLSRYCVEYYFD